MVFPLWPFLTLHDLLLFEELSRINSQTHSPVGDAMVAAGSRGGGIVISCPRFSLPSSEMAGKGGLCV